MKIKQIFMLIGIFIILLAKSPATAAGDILMTDLGTLGGTDSDAIDINNHGQIVGSSITADGQHHAFIWENDLMMDLGTLGGLWSESKDINDKGQIVGISSIVSGEPHAFLWENGVMLDLGTLGGSQSTAMKINERGQIAGYSTPAGGYDHAFLWENGVMTDLLPNKDYSRALDINEAGQVVGVGKDDLGDTHAFLWENDGFTDLGILSGDRKSSIAIAINNRGQVVGSSGTASGFVHGFFWENGVMTDLGSLGNWSGVYAINEHSQVVGWSGHNEFGNRAYLWENGVMNDLGALGGGTSGAQAVNELGQVTGLSTTVTGLGSGNPHAFIWESGVMTDLGTLGGPWSMGKAINDQGQVAGQSLIGQNEYHAVLWQRAPAIVNVTIDVNPKSTNNIITLQNPGTVPVVIFSSPGFNAVTQVSRSSLTFGRTGMESTLYYVPAMMKMACTGSDVNVDGRTDLLCMFRVTEMGFQCGDTQGFLEGNLTGGARIHGMDLVKIRPCP